MTTTPTYHIIPALRFPDFQNDGGWEVKRLGDLFVRVTDRNKENNRNVLTISAQYGLVNQFEYFSKNVAASDVTNYYIIQKGDFAYNKSRSQGYPFGAIKPLLLYDKGVVSTLYICFRLKEDCGCDADFYRFYFETGLINDQISNIAQEGARNHGLLNISTEDFFNINLFVPPLAEQRRIAACLSALDEMLAATNEKLEQMKAYKRGLIQQLFADSIGGGKSLKISYLPIPKLRFPAFYQEKEWEEKKLGDCFTERIERNCSKLPLLSLTESDGIVLQEETNRKNNSNTDKSKYLRVCVGDIAYNTMRMWQGRCAWVGIEGIVSPAYTICMPNEKMDSLFFFYLFKTPNAIELFHRNSQGLVNDTLNLKYESFKKIKMCVPTYFEQCKIALCLSSMDETINAYTEKVGLLGQYKKGLMQQMFVN